MKVNKVNITISVELIGDSAVINVNGERYKSFEVLNDQHLINEVARAFIVKGMHISVERVAVDAS
jgi:hypothetical protein